MADSFLQPQHLLVREVVAFAKACQARGSTQAVLVLVLPAVLAVLGIPVLWSNEKQTFTTKPRIAAQGCLALGPHQWILVRTVRLTRREA